jgi:hypothetical protein
MKRVLAIPGSVLLRRVRVDRDAVDMLAAARGREQLHGSIAAGGDLTEGSLFIHALDVDLPWYVELYGPVSASAEVCAAILHHGVKSDTVQRRLGQAGSYALQALYRASIPARLLTPGAEPSVGLLRSWQPEASSLLDEHAPLLLARAAGETGTVPVAPATAMRVVIAAAERNLIDVPRALQLLACVDQTGASSLPPGERSQTTRAGWLAAVWLLEAGVPAADVLAAMPCAVTGALATGGWLPTDALDRDAALAFARVAPAGRLVDDPFWAQHLPAIATAARCRIPDTGCGAADR